MSRLSFLFLLLLTGKALSFDTGCQQHYFWTGTQCKICNRSDCPIGMYREQCVASYALDDAECYPCKSPPFPDHTVFTSSGLPFLGNTCMWECIQGYFFDGSACVQCSVEPCTLPRIRDTCTQGSTEDAACVCAINEFIDGDTCSPCQHTSCATPSEFTQCPGHTQVDISACADVGSDA